jgi:hypothetical protein
MTDSDLVTVHVFPDRIEADLASSALEAAGIESMVAGDDAGETQPGLWGGRGVALLVRQADEQAAREILDTAAKVVDPDNA